MTKKVKILTGLFGIVSASALLAVSVVSCSSNSSNNNNDNSSSGGTSSSNSSSSTYNTSDGWDKLTTTVTKNSSGASWTSSTATQNFQTTFNNLSSAQQTQSIIDAITAGGVAYDNYLSSNNLLGKNWPTIQNPIVVKSTYYTITQNYNLTIKNITGSNNDYNFDIVYTDDISASTTARTFPDIIISTITYKFTGVSFKCGLGPNSFSKSNSADNYAAFIISNYSGYVEDKSTIVNPSSNADPELAKAIWSSLTSEANGFTKSSNPVSKSYPEGLDNSIQWFIYVNNGGINYGEI